MLPADIYSWNSRGSLVTLIAFSSPVDEPDSVVVTMDGRDAEFFKKLVKILGSEARAQELILLEGYLSKIKQSAQIPMEDVRKIEALWPKVIGMSREEIETRMSRI
jgi:hypothetical protein